MRAKAVLLAGLVFAAPPLCFPSFADDLEDTKADLQKSQARQEQLAGQEKKIEGELSDIQKRLVKIAAAIQGNETELTDSEEKLHILDGQLKPRQEKLNANQKRMAMLVQLSLKLSQMPPEAMVMMPGDVETSMQAATALKMATKSLKDEVQETTLQIAEIRKLEDKIMKRRDAIAATTQDLTEEQKKLEDNLNQRKGLRAKLKGQEEDEAEKAEQLAKKEEDLQGVISSLRASEHKPGRFATGQSGAGEKGSLRSFASARGRIRRPASGRLVRAFGAPTHGDETARGATFATRKAAAVLAPYDAEVVFAGPFLNYGKMVILRHSDDFHTLLSGLARIDVKVGEFLLEGEPIGAMGEGESDNRLYVELRKDNQPVDPLPWMKKEEK